MDAEFAKRWVADLRDPSNKQCTGMLHNGSGYCCLGRAVVLSGAALVPLKHESWSADDTVSIVTESDQFVIDGTQHDDGTEGEQECLPVSIARQIGMTTAYGRPTNGGRVEIGPGTYASLADANDDGCTFNQIAGWIEANYERL